MSSHTIFISSICRQMSIYMCMFFQLKLFFYLILFSHAWLHSNPMIINLYSHFQFNLWAEAYSSRSRDWLAALGLLHSPGHRIISVPQDTPPRQELHFWSHNAMGSKWDTIYTRLLFLDYNIFFFFKLKYLFRWNVNKVTTPIQALKKKSNPKYRPIYK